MTAPSDMLYAQSAAAPLPVVEYEAPPSTISAPMSPLHPSLQHNAQAHGFNRKRGFDQVTTSILGIPAPLSPLYPMVEGSAQKRSRKMGAQDMRVWDFEEDQKLLDLVDRLGKRWKAISGEFADRTEAMCRNRYGRMCAPHKPEMKNWKESKNKCGACGQLKKGHSCPVKNKLLVTTGQDDDYHESDAAFEPTVVSASENASVYYPPYTAPLSTFAAPLSTYEDPLPTYSAPPAAATMPARMDSYATTPMPVRIESFQSFEGKPMDLLSHLADQFCEASMPLPALQRIPSAA